MTNPSSLHRERAPSRCRRGALRSMLADRAGARPPSLRTRNPPMGKRRWRLPRKIELTLIQLCMERAIAIDGILRRLKHVDTQVRPSRDV